MLDIFIVPKFANLILIFFKLSRKKQSINTTLSLLVYSGITING